MKVFAKLENGKYLIEATSDEIKAISGIEDRDQYGNPRGIIGAEMHIKPAWDHIGKIIHNDGQRKGIAEQLRAAAAVIENTPLIASLPADPPVSEKPEQ